MISLLLIPFLVCVALVLIHVHFGVKVLARGILFIDLAIAQWAGLGYLLGHFWQIENAALLYGISFGFTLVPALLLTGIRSLQPQTNYLEAVIGVLYIVAAATATVVVSITGMEFHHLENMLVGHLLFVTPSELLAATAIYALVGAIHYWARKWLCTSQSKGADLLFYVTFGLVVTSSVKLAGVLAVFSFLVLPALIMLPFSASQSRQLRGGWIIGIFASIAGLAVSIYSDIPPGVSVILALAGIWIGSMGIWIVRRSSDRALNNPDA